MFVKLDVNNIIVGICSVYDDSLGTITEVLIDDYEAMGQEVIAGVVQPAVETEDDIKVAIQSYVDATAQSLGFDDINLPILFSFPV